MSICMIRSMGCTIAVTNKSPIELSILMQLRSLSNAKTSAGNKRNFILEYLFHYENI